MRRWKKKSLFLGLYNDTHKENCWKLKEKEENHTFGGGSARAREKVYK